MLSLNSNIASQGALRKLSSATAALSLSFERLASGQRINRASDDAAGLAIADSLNAQARLYGAAQRNLQDGISLINIADSTLDNQGQIVSRLIELAEQSANGTYTSQQRSALSAEYRELLYEFGRLGDTARFNGIDLLRGFRSDSLGEIVLQAGITGEADSQINISTGDTGSLSGVVDFKRVSSGMIDPIQAATSFDSISELFNHKIIQTKLVDNTGEEREVLLAFAGEGDGGNNLSVIAFTKGEDSTTHDEEWKLDVDSFVGAMAGNFGTSLSLDQDTGMYSADGPIEFTIGGVGDLSLNVEGLRFVDNGLWNAETQNATSDQSQITAIDLTGVETVSRAQLALTVLKNRLSSLATIRGEFGAAASRLNTALNVVSSSQENSYAAESRIRDADIAGESANLIRMQILQRAAISVLAQANQQPQLALSLLGR